MEKRLMKPPTPSKQFEYLIKNAEGGGWGFFGWKDKGIKNYHIEETSGGRLRLFLFIKRNNEFTPSFDLATVLCDLDFRKVTFGENNRFVISSFETTGQKDSESGDYLYNGGIDHSEYKLISNCEWYSREMFSQGDSLDMLLYAYLFAKGQDEKSIQKSQV